MTQMPPSQGAGPYPPMTAGTATLPGPVPMPSGGATLPGAAPVPPGTAPVQPGTGQGGWPPAGSWPPGSLPPGPLPPRRRRGPAVILAVVAVLLTLLVVAAGAFLAGRAMRPADRPAVRFPYGAAAPNAQPTTGGGGPTDAQVAAVAAKVNPAVVDVNTVLGYQNGRAAGTGVVLRSDGLVLTNNHVVAGATSISVTDVGDGRTYPASVVGYDRTEDLAVIKLSGASGLATAVLGDSSSVKAGDPIVALGNAGGTGGTPSAVGGTVAALNQSITAQDESTGSSERLSGLIQVAAAIESGDSGGPLVTTSGQVIGIDTAASTSFSYQQSGGQGYAIPINQALGVARQIEAGQASSTVHIGPTAFLGIGTGGQAGAGDTSGAAVLGTLSGSPAEAAGLARGDVIQSVDGHAVDSATTLTNLLDGYHPGDAVKIGWVDGSGQSHTATITLTTGPVG